MPDQNISHNHYKKYTQLIHTIGASVITNAIPAMFYALVSTVNEPNKLILLFLFSLFMPFSYFVYHSKYKTRPSIQIYPYILTPIILTLVALIIKPFAPYATALFLLLNADYFLQFGTKNLIKYIVYVCIIYILYAFTTTTSELNAKLILTIWLIEATISITICDVIVRNELTNTKEESRELVAVNRQRKDQSAKLETILNNLQEAIILIDSNLNITKINKTASVMLVYTSKEAQSLKINDVISKQNISDAKQSLNNPDQQNQDSDELFWLRSKNGEDIPSSLRIIQDKEDSETKILLFSL